MHAISATHNCQDDLGRSLIPPCHVSLHGFFRRLPLFMGYKISTKLCVLGALCVRIVIAQRLAYTSFAVTECFTRTVPQPDFGLPSLPLPHNKPSKGGNSCPEIISISYTMPPCIYCNCPGCTILSKFATAYPVFCTEGEVGIKNQRYAVTETYLGLSSLPHFESPTDVPFGFTARLETCEAGVCGPEATTAPMTYPTGGTPFVGTALPAAESSSPTCGVQGGEDCSTIATRHLDTGTSESPAAPASAPPQATAVTADGSILRRSLLITWSMMLLIVIGQR